ncbi:nuclear transport factor 2 family protein [Fluviicola sp.]|uniref:nuclear transport factor 2 family protein n=1 Tax=Fluviicola sp. TaxID=1917219 RepID=UPI0031E1065C
MKLFTIAWILCIVHGIHAQKRNVMETKTTKEEAIKAVLQDYLEGIRTGDTTLLGQTFHPDALCIAFRRHQRNSLR